MLKRLLKLLPNRTKSEDSPSGVFQIEAPTSLVNPGAEPFAFEQSLTFVNNLPVPNWQAVRSWAASIQDPRGQAQAWAGAELAWVSRMQSALGPDYHLAQHEHALMLSNLEPRVAVATVEFMTKTLSRIGRVLDGIAKAPDWGRDILFVFHDQDTYYEYVSRYYPEDGEFAFSGGMHINFGCSHFATFQEDLRSVEPVIAHEMTLACLAHLLIPAWLNEGLAVNTERRLCPPPGSQYTPQQLHWMHQQFWSPERIQEFWTGQSFMRPDEGNMLSYDLARILVDQFARDWDNFKAFVLNASLEDSGSAAAQAHLELNLGDVVCALFEFDTAVDWSPSPSAWQGSPERGAFRGDA